MRWLRSRWLNKHIHLVKFLRDVMGSVASCGCADSQGHPLHILEGHTNSVKGALELRMSGSCPGAGHKTPRLWDTCGLLTGGFCTDAPISREG